MSAHETPFAPSEIAALLAAAATTLRTELGALPARLLAWHPAPAEWCAREVVGHLIEAEQRGFAARIRFILDHDEPRLTSWDQDEVVRARGDCARDVESLLAEFETLRSAGVKLVAGLRPADLGRGGHHPKVGSLRIGDLLHEWVHHDRNHLRQIMANVQACAWPGMGNAQRFSAPP